MITNCWELIAHLSTAFTLLPGTIIATGTPAGVGFVMDPPRCLKAGSTRAHRDRQTGGSREPGDRPTLIATKEEPCRRRCPLRPSDAAARARELIPELRERAAQTALDRRIPQSQHRRAAPRRRAEDHPGHAQRRLRPRHPQPPRRDERARSGLRLDGVGRRRRAGSLVAHVALPRAGPRRRVRRQRRRRGLCCHRAPRQGRAHLRRLPPARACGRSAPAASGPTGCCSAASCSTTTATRSIKATSSCRRRR